MNNYNKAQIDYREGCKARIKRQMEISKPFPFSFHFLLQPTILPALHCFLSFCCPLSVCPVCLSFLSCSFIFVFDSINSPGHNIDVRSYLINGFFFCFDHSLQPPQGVILLGGVTAFEKKDHPVCPLCFMLFVSCICLVLARHTIT